MHVLSNCSQQGKFALWQSISEVQGKVGEICGGMSQRNFWRKNFCKAKRDFRRKKPPNKFHLQIPPFSKRAIDTSQEPCLPSLRSARGNSSGQGTLCVHALQTRAPSKRHEEGYQSWGFLFSLQSREPCGIVTAQLH